MINFFKKKKNVVVPHQEPQEEEPFVIPQIDDPERGLRTTKPGFKSTPAISPMTGEYVPDRVEVQETETHDDLDVAYDPFRVNRQLTKEDEEARYGQAYHEFPSIDQSSVFDQEEFQREKARVEAQVVVEEELSLGFNVIEDINEPVVEEEVVIPVSSGAQIHYGETQETQEPDFSEVNINQEIKEETETAFVAKPQTRLTDFVATKAEEAEDESIPKTIIIHSPRKVEEENPEPVFSTGMTNLNQYVEQPTVEKPEEYVVEEPVVEDEEYVGLNQDEQPNYAKVPDFLTQKPVQETVRKEYVAPEMPKPQPQVQPTNIIHKDKYLNYKYPSLSLLDPAPAASTEIPEFVEIKKQALNQTLIDFGIDGEVVEFTYGPSVTRYEIKLQSGINVRKITTIEDTIKMNLMAKSIRIEAPIPGKSNVGIEIPNEKVRSVSFTEIANRDEFIHASKPLTACLGLAIDGSPVYTSIAKMPHGLIAGGTGSGKSVSMNGIIISLLLKNSPDDCKMILVDPKQVELSVYGDLPHLATPVITDVRLASEALNWACEEMDRRYKAFSALRVREIASYNEKIANDPTLKKLPFLVIIIDELADLMITCGKEVETSITRITQLGRAAGIHMLIATQRPTTDIVKGTIKNNIATRIAFRVPDYVSSSTILDQGGAEALLGYGDMLIKDGDIPKRVQGAYIKDSEIERITDFIRANYQPDYLFTHEELEQKTKEAYGAGQAKANDEDPELIYCVAESVVTRGVCSVNNIQNSFSIGFNRAKRIVEILEEMGIVSENKGTTGREILVTMADVDEMFAKGQ